MAGRRERRSAEGVAPLKLSPRDLYQGKALAKACWVVLPGAAAAPTLQMTQDRLRADVLNVPIVRVIERTVLDAFANDACRQGILRAYVHDEIARVWDTSFPVTYRCGCHCDIFPAIHGGAPGRAIPPRDHVHEWCEAVAAAAHVDCIQVHFIRPFTRTLALRS